MSERVEVDKLTLHPLIDSTYTRKQRPVPTGEGEFKNTPKVAKDSHFADTSPLLLTDPRVLDVADGRGWDHIKADLDGPYSDEHAERLAVLQANDNPEMTPGGEVKYALEWEEVFEEEARRRQGTRTDLAPELAEGRNWGEAAEEACKHVSFGSSTFRYGKLVKQAAEQGTWGLNAQEPLPQKAVEVAREEWAKLKEDPNYGIKTAHDEVKKAKRRGGAIRKEEWMAGERIFEFRGGKSSIANWLISKFPEHTTYVEPFAGSAAVLFNKPPSEQEVLNDIREPVTNFFEVLRDRADELERELADVELTKQQHDIWTKHWDEGWRPEDEVKRAAVVFFRPYSQYRPKESTHSGFAYPDANPEKAEEYREKKTRLTEFQQRFKRDDVTCFTERFDLSAEHFAGPLDPVHVESRDFEEALQSHDAEDTLFYIDPPYEGFERDYDSESDEDEKDGHFHREDHERLVEVLTELEGEFILSYGEKYPNALDEYRVIKMERPDRREEEDEIAIEHHFFSFPESEEGTFRPGNIDDAAKADWS